MGRAIRGVVSGRLSNDENLFFLFVFHLIVRDYSCVISKLF